MIKDCCALDRADEAAVRIWTLFSLALNWKRTSLHVGSLKVLNAVFLMSIGVFPCVSQLTIGDAAGRVLGQQRPRTAHIKLAGTGRTRPGNYRKGITRRSRRGCQKPGQARMLRLRRTTAFDAEILSKREYEKKVVVYESPWLLDS